MFDWVLNTILQFILQWVSDVYQLEVLAICLFKFPKHIPPSSQQHSARPNLEAGCSVRKGVLRNFSTFTEKCLCQGPFFNKVRAQPATLLKKDSGTGVSLWILQNFREHLFTEHLWITASANPCYLMFNVFAEWQKL